MPAMTNSEHTALSPPDFCLDHCIGTVGNKKEAFHTAGLDECEYPEALAASMCSTASIASEASPNRRYSSRHDPQTRRIPWQWFVPDRRRDRIVLRPSA